MKTPKSQKKHICNSVYSKVWQQAEWQKKAENCENISTLLLWLKKSIFADCEQIVHKIIFS
jgi:hypothetical protein